MEPQEEQRRLTTILAADVVGYSRLMGADEAGTLVALKAHRKELIEPKTAQYRGRTVKLMGDGALMEFGSVVDAVRFAVEVQAAMLKRNADVPEDFRIEYRIGLNIGDIIVDGDDIYGDGVNIAARLEGLAEPGGICIARNVFDQIRGKLALTFEPLGEQHVKNITEPVEVYQMPIDGAAIRLLTPVSRVQTIRPQRWVAAAAVAILAVGAVGGYWTWDNWWRFQRTEAASIEQMALPLPDKPSVAVLPFDNLSGDPNHDTLADGLSEDIIAALARLPELFVIARNSTFPYKGQQVRVQQVAEELGVHYVLDGSTQMDGDRLRVTAQLIDALTGEHIWVDRYDREAAELFAVRDEITLNVVSSVGAELATGDRERILRRETDSLEAWLLYREAYSAFISNTAEDIIPARELLRRAIEIDPGFVSAHASLGGSYRIEGQFWPGEKPPEEYYRVAREHFDRALALDPTHGYTHGAIAGLHLAMFEFDEAVAAGRTGVANAPSSWINHLLLAWALNRAVRPSEAIPEFKVAMRLNPNYPDNLLTLLGEGQLLVGDFAEAEQSFREALDRNPGRFIEAVARVRLAVVLAETGREDEARRQIRDAVDIFPHMSTSYMSTMNRYRDQSVNDRFNAIWSGLGMPE